MEKIFAYIDQNLNRFIEELFVLLRQPSISARWEGVEECSRLLTRMMEKLGVKTRVFPRPLTGLHLPVLAGKRNPPLVYGEVLNPAAQKTLLIYGHYDVQPPEPLEEWTSLPFEPSIREGKIYGRGSADDKGQLFAHLKAVEAARQVQGVLPVNVKFLFDPEEEV